MYDWQAPLLQAPPWHERPHVPQLFGSVCVSTQVLLQIVGAELGHAQMLDWHVLPPVHAVVQLPQ
jgi:hypothetical protein